MTVLVGSGADGNNATIADLADVEFKLDGGVVNLEALTQHGTNRDENVGAGGSGHVSDAHVAGE